MKRTAASIAVFLGVLGIFWIGGLDVGRGPTQALAFVYAIVLAAMTYGFPGWSDS